MLSISQSLGAQNRKRKKKGQELAQSSLEYNVLGNIVFVLLFGVLVYVPCCNFFINNNRCEDESLSLTRLQTPLKRLCF